MPCLELHVGQLFVHLGSQGCIRLDHHDRCCHCSCLLCVGASPAPPHQACMAEAPRKEVAVALVMGLKGRALSTAAELAAAHVRVGRGGMLSL